MTTQKGANVTKYDAGGSGDNIISRGYIKSTEKVWVDSFTYSSAATIGSVSQVEIAILPEGSRVLGIEVYGLNDLSATSTNAVSIGTKLAAGTTNATLFLAATTFGTATGIGIMGYGGCLRANSNIGYQLTGGTNRLFLYFTAANPSVTSGTITTIVRYT